MALTDEQMTNARIIIEVGHRVGASQRDILIGLMTAAQESEFRNMSGGDRDSAGLFQQRPSQGWGNWNQVTDPYYAAETFFKGTQGNPGLFSLKNRSQMSLTEAAQAVQRSAYPDAYAKHETLARSLMGNTDAALAEPGQFTTDSVDDGGSYPSPPPQDIDTPTSSMKPTAPEPVRTRSSDGQPVGIRSGGPTDSGAAGIKPGGAVGIEALMPVGVTADEYSMEGPGGSVSESTWDIPTVDKETFTNEFLGAGQPWLTDGKARAGLGADIVTAATHYIGTPYVWGGNGFDGVDCSGLVQQALGAVGITAPRLSSEQATFGARVGLDALQPGDLVAWDVNERNGSGAEHIAVYAGNGYIIEAPRPGLNVRRRRLDTGDSNAWGVRLTGRK